MSDIIKVDFLRGQNFCFEILHKKKSKNITKKHLLCVKYEEEKNVKEVKMHNFLVFTCKSQDLAQSLKNCACSHDRETVTFRNSVYCRNIDVFPSMYTITSKQCLFREVQKYNMEKNLLLLHKGRRGRVGVSSKEDSSWGHRGQVWQKLIFRGR